MRIRNNTLRRISFSEIAESPLEQTFCQSAQKAKLFFITRFFVDQRLDPI
jgi:hypothetical protein